VVWIHGKIEHFHMHLFRGLTDDLFETMLDLSDKYGSSSFRTPHQRVVDQVDLCSGVLIAHVLHALQYSS
jgi:hypothetical protein